MYCKNCGCEMKDGESYCSQCGCPVGSAYYRGTVTPGVPVTGGFADPNLLFRSRESKIFGAICAFVYGLGMIGGGIYGILTYTEATHWAIAGGIGAILGGIGCLIGCAGLVSRLVSRKGEQ